MVLYILELTQMYTELHPPGQVSADVREVSHCQGAVVAAQLFSRAV